MLFKFYLCKRIKIIKLFTFNTTFWFITGPILNDRYDNFSEQNKVNNSSGTKERQTWENDCNDFL